MTKMPLKFELITKMSSPKSRNLDGSSSLNKIFDIFTLIEWLPFKWKVIEPTMREDISIRNSIEF